MRYRIPPHLKETVTVVRQSAFDREEEVPVASAVTCMIMPERDLIRLDSGVPVQFSGWEALLEKPNPDIAEGDILKRADKSELQVHRIRALGAVMILELKDDAQRVP